MIGSTSTHRGVKGNIICRSIPSSLDKNRKLYVFIDETGDLGTVAKSRYYIICACLVSDSSRFSEPVKKLGLPGEFHARKKPHEVPNVVSSAMPTILRVYHVALIKDDQHNPPSPIKHMTHSKMLQTVADRILSDIPNDLDITVDGTGMIPGTLVQGIFKKNPHRGNRNVEVNVRSSKDDLGLQTHDAITWLHGQMYKDNLEHSYLIMSRMHTAIVSKAEWYEQIHDPLSETLISEDDELHMLRWEYDYYNPEKCYGDDAPDFRLKGYPKDWDEFLAWAYDELQTANHAWPESLPNFEEFRKQHPKPIRYSNGRISNSKRGTEHAKNVHLIVYETRAPDKRSASGYNKSTPNNSKQPDHRRTKPASVHIRSSKIGHVSERTKQVGSRRRDSPHSRK